MKVTYNTEGIQTLVPVIIDVSDTSSAPTIVVSSLQDDALFEPFTIDTQKLGDYYQGQFWLEQKGDYKISVTHGTETSQHVFTVTDHFFLPFSVEFGVFSVGLTVAFIGVFLWHKSKIKFQKT